MGDRRSFIKTSGIITGGLCCGASLLESCVSYSYVPHSIENKTIAVEKSSFTDKSYVAIDVEKFPAPVLIHKNENGEYSAVLAECTHRKCTVKPEGAELKCPCHGSRFTFKGKVLEGPADTDLKKFKISTDDAKIYLS
jgi:cytochrome b6-f complex iron-sulfur subunit